MLETTIKDAAEVSAAAGWIGSHHRSVYQQRVRHRCGGAGGGSDDDKVIAIVLVDDDVVLGEAAQRARSDREYNRQHLHQNKYRNLHIYGDISTATKRNTIDQSM